MRVKKILNNAQVEIGIYREKLFLDTLISPGKLPNFDIIGILYPK